MKWYKSFVVFWTIIYFIIAIVGRVFTYNKEVFPFFRWSLYSKTPNKITNPYVMVHKIGDSLLAKPVSILDLYTIHKINKVDMNLNVANFYKDITEQPNAIENYQGNFLNILPDKSEFTLFTKDLDLSKIKYKETKKIKKILTVRDSKISDYEAVD